MTARPTDAAQSAMTLAVCLSCALLVSNAVFAQPPPVISQLYHKAWSIREGAPGSITSIAQTTDGYLWLANPAGLYRFDGVRFERIALQNEKEVGAAALLKASTDGALWIANRGGNVTRLHNGQFTTFTERDGVPPGQVLAITVDRAGGVWIASFAGVARFIRSQWERVGEEAGLPSRGARAIYGASDGSVWIASQRVLYALRPHATRAERFDVPAEIRSIAEDAEGTIWAADMGNTVRPWVRRDGRAPAGQMLSGQARPIFFDSRGALWLAPNTGGVQRTRASITEVMTSEAGLTGDDVFDIFEDRESNIWVATSAGFDLFRETVLSAATLPSNGHATRLAAGEDGSIWAGGQNYSLRRLDDGEVKIFDVPAPIFSLHRESAGRVWAWAGEDLWRSAGDRFTKMPRPPFSGDTASALATDRTGRLWASFLNNGLYVFNGLDWRRPALPALPAKSGPVRLATTDQTGLLWLAYRDGTLISIDGDDVEFRASALPVGSPTALHVAPERIWLGGDQALALIEGRQSRIVPGFGDAVIGRIRGVVEATDGSLWLNADRGIVQIQAREVRRILADPTASPEFRVFDYLDGGIGGAVLIPAQSAIVGSDGRLWFAGIDSVVTLDPTRILTNPLPPPVHIQSVRVAEREYPASDEVRLPVGTRQVEIKYTGLSLTLPDRVHFQYLLDGVDTTWQDAGTRRQAFYTNLRPGYYKFQVIASNNDGLWNKTGAAMSFVVPPAFYQTTAFRAAVLFSLVGLAWLVYRLRLRQVSAHLHARLEERLTERERIARELHDTLLQGLQGIILKFQAVAGKLPPGDAAARMIEETLERADRVMVESRDRVRDLRVSTEAGAELSTVLAQAGEDLARDTALEFRVVIEGEPRNLHPIIREECYWIGREALINAFHHSSGTRIEAEIWYGAGEFRIRCRDDGRGVGPEVLAGDGPGSHWGVRGMRERAKRIGGTLEIWSRPTAGTEVELRVPAAVAYPAFAGAWWPRLRRLTIGRSTP